MLENIYGWIKREKVLFISALSALGTMFWITPDAEYITYIDWRVLALLFSLMAVTAGFQNCGIFHWLAVTLLKHSRYGWVLSVILVLLPFFCAMLVTNDVALLTFVPFTLLLLDKIIYRKYAVIILVLQTLAANLGSMATPVGNPQNLFLYTTYELSASEFFSVMFPLTLISFIILTMASFMILPKKLPDFELEGQIGQPVQLVIYGILFIGCLLTVFRILPYQITTIVVFLTLSAVNIQILKHLDYALLATFICFFIVSGNLGRMEAVQDFLQLFLQKDILLTAAVSSQFISNVPAAVLLSEFTNDWKPLLEGVNIGGLGTPVASLASLITLKIYLSYPGADLRKYFFLFTSANVTGLIILLTAAVI